MSRATAALSLLIFSASCAAPRVTLPSGSGTPFPAFASAYAQAIGDCRAIKTLSASLALSGRAGSTKLSARIDGGFAESGRLRLEGYPRVNFGGKPFFVLVARGPDATLVLTRDRRVLRGAAPAAVLEALAGIALEPDELRALVSGCALGAGQPADGRSFKDGWVALEAEGTTVFLRQIEGQWRVAGARRGPLTVEYSNFAGGRPSTLHLHTTSARGVSPADLTLRISQVEINTPLDNAVFYADVPPNAVPLTLEELRRAGPLGGPEGTEGTEITEQDQHGDTEVAETHGGDGPGRAALRAANRAWDQECKPPCTLDRAVCIPGPTLDSLRRPKAGARPGPSLCSVFLPCLRASVVISSRALRVLRQHGPPV